VAIFGTINLIRTGKTRTMVVERLFKTMFSDDIIQGYKEFELYRKNKKNKKDTDKIVDFKKNNSLIDDLDL